MSKRFWVEIKKWDKGLVTAALESGVQGMGWNKLRGFFKTGGEP